MAEETIPISRATARSDSPAAPSVASCRRAISVISLMSSARTRSRAVRPAFTQPAYQSTALPVRAPLASLSPRWHRPDPARTDLSPLAPTSPRSHRPQLRDHEFGGPPVAPHQTHDHDRDPAGTRVLGLFGPAVHGEASEKFAHLARDPLD